MYNENYAKAYKLGRREYNQRRNRRENPSCRCWTKWCRALWHCRRGRCIW